MADHAVGGVDRLVERAARQARRRRARTAGATTPSEKFSARLSMAARATPASSSAAMSRPTICDDGCAAGFDAPALERRRRRARHGRTGCAGRSGCSRLLQRRGSRTGGPARCAPRPSRSRRRRREGSAARACPECVANAPTRRAPRHSRFSPASLRWLLPPASLRLRSLSRSGAKVGERADSRAKPDMTNPHG